MWVGTTAVGSQVAVDDARTTAVEQAVPLARVCAQDPEAAVRAGADCAAAVAVARGEDGDDGKPGIGVAGTRIVDGRLFVSYSDGREQDVGRVVGRDGVDGPEGRGIQGTTLEGGRLVVTFTDGTRTDLGPIEGAPGRGIASTAAVDGRLIITYTDGREQDAGPLPKGDPGDEGKQGAAAPTVQRQTFHLEDGRVRVCDRTGGTDEAVEYRCGPAAAPEEGAGDGSG